MKGYSSAEIIKDRYVFPALFCYQDDNDDVGVVFPDLPGCVSQGDNEIDALRMAREALSLHLFGMLNDGDFIPDPTNLREIIIEQDTRPVLVDVLMESVPEKLGASA